MTVHTYRAPWSRWLVGMSIAATVICVDVAVGLAVFLPKPGIGVAVWLMVAIPPVASLFIVRGYRITPEAILVLRPGWVTRLPREGLAAVSFEPGAIRRSLRLSGNGGFFSFTGFYWNRELGRHRVFVTDGQRTVVLRYSNRTVVVSPDRPEEFVRELRETV